MKKSEFDCYKCKYRKPLDGNAHSKCTNKKGTKTLRIEANVVGVKNGWFYFPHNYDPIWLENCEGFRAKGTKEMICIRCDDEVHPNDDYEVKTNGNVLCSICRED